MFFQTIYCILENVMKNSKLKEWCIETKNELEKNKTYAEKAFKYYLVKNKIGFETQKIIKTKKNKIYFLDFYLPDYKIAIEIDGKYHSTDEQIKKDSERDNDLLKLGIKTFRITNKQVIKGQYNINNILKL